MLGRRDNTMRVKKNECRHIACLNARTGTLYIKAILSHAEYDKWCRSDIR
ncbi:TPA: type II toxin-antitoxin system HigB family toxin [Pseudomonas putida]|nr:type II toxin-antitoxin system HigB family toxin [Pseudomonas putida]EKT4554325.1 type II toxin-antitoxin system HigB family toxin [Pseudomonas putida]ELU0815386.1 type II toxin-antitoxin system HigB family toxin [Pseudomonas putida]MBH3347277.1 type II toxin-antitoxin system HigB family toxin [Pseudomonas putida]MBH3389605.1 type II toxin-antitoxin system HigB family toxin [Pseudomonas putida]